MNRQIIHTSYAFFSRWFIGVCSLNANLTEHSVCSSFIGRWIIHKKSIRHSEHSESLKSRIHKTFQCSYRTRNHDVAISIWVSGTAKEVDKTLTNSWYIGVSHRVENEADATIIRIQASAFITHSICTALIFPCGICLVVLEMYGREK
jgi:hypothetical protein